MKKFLLMGTTALLALGLAACGDQETSSTADEPKQEEVKEEKSFKIGDLVTVGDMEYTIDGKSNPSTVSSKASSTYLILDVKLKNNGNEAVTVDSSFFRLKSGEKTYEADSAASMSANQKEDGTIDNSFSSQKLNPDSEISGKIVFDVAPEVAKASDLQVQVQKDAETELIDLN
ncbi:DUF4352 domain-containing protein [Peribacillus asahii]|uniref:DUF4352 domain-containing protein n=1 Tax=Peribacillus asahii TaxID=228899 RepID=UPI00207964D7|nr:DUF4352 domain-containing protein [Peribacillus asahii]USK58265.1 DUF4352 domain-containing protein [Peribacillus asahii]